MEFTRKQPKNLKKKIKEVIEEIKAKKKRTRKPKKKTLKTAVNTGAKLVLPNLEQQARASGLGFNRAYGYGQQLVNPSANTGTIVQDQIRNQLAPILRYGSGSYVPDIPTIFGQGRSRGSNINYFTGLGFPPDQAARLADAVVRDIRLGVPPDEARRINTPGELQEPVAEARVPNRPRSAPMGGRVAVPPLNLGRVNPDYEFIGISGSSRGGSSLDGSNPTYPESANARTATVARASFGDVPDSRTNLGITQQSHEIPDTRQGEIHSGYGVPNTPSSYIVVENGTHTPRRNSISFTSGRNPDGEGETFDEQLQTPDSRAIDSFSGSPRVVDVVSPMTTQQMLQDITMRTNRMMTGIRGDIARGERLDRIINAYRTGQAVDFPPGMSVYEMADQLSSQMDTAIARNLEYPRQRLEQAEMFMEDQRPMAPSYQMFD